MSGETVGKNGDDENVAASEAPSLREWHRRPGPSYQEILSWENRPVPPCLREERNDYVEEKEAVEIERGRYFSDEFYRLEAERMWTRTWQIACRMEEIPEVGDHVVYEVIGKSLIVARSGPSEIKAFHNVCLHRGRILRETGGHVAKFRCKFHGFAWDLQGKLSFVPCRWDFPHLRDNECSLPEAKVATWGGFVFINMDLNAVSLEEYLQDLPAHFSTWNYENFYKAWHIGMVIDANWKIVAEAFMEGMHTVATHPQILASTGDGNAQYDARKDRPHYQRALVAGGLPSPYLAGQVDDQKIIEALGTQIPGIEDLKVPPGLTARQAAAQFVRDRLQQANPGKDFSSVSDTEMIDLILYFVFPNVLLYGGAMNVFYRFRPLDGETHESLMEVVMLLPKPTDGPAPAPAAMRLLEPGQTFTDAFGGMKIGQFLDQDVSNIAMVHKGLRAAHRRGFGLSRYQESNIRHFHRTLDMYLYGENR
jgi:phenylpropionate dioxygenase-like ring-hydroxylating dioxygenase large terminal subunit